MVSGKTSKTLRLLRKSQNLLPKDFDATYNYIKLSSDPILIVAKSYLIKYIICLFTKNWNLFSICLLGHSWSHTIHLLRKPLPRARFRITPVTKLVQEMNRNVLQNLEKQKPAISFQINT